MHDETMSRAVVTNEEGLDAVGGATGGPAKGPTGEAREGGAQPVEVKAAGRGQATEGHFEMGAAQRAFESVRGEIEALDPAEIVTVRVDVQKIAAIVITLLWRDAAPERRKGFERFAAQGDYDITLLERLPALARSVWLLRRQQQRALFISTGATLSEEERLAAFELRGHMMTELEYHCSDLPNVRAELEHLRQGSGHQDLANDLETVVDLSARDDVRPRLEKSPKYRPGASAEALRLAERLLRSLGVGEAGEAERLTGLLQRATTLMLRAYEKHSIRGRFLFHEAEDVDLTYPSLVAAARSPRRKRQADEPAGGDAGGGGAGAGGDAGGGGAGAGGDAGGQGPGGEGAGGDADEGGAEPALRKRSSRRRGGAHRGPWVRPESAFGALCPNAVGLPNPRG